MGRNRFAGAMVDRQEIGVEHLGAVSYRQRAQLGEVLGVFRRVARAIGPGEIDTPVIEAPGAELKHAAVAEAADEGHSCAWRVGGAH